MKRRKSQENFGDQSASIIAPNPSYVAKNEFKAQSVVSSTTDARWNARVLKAVFPNARLPESVIKRGTSSLGSLTRTIQTNVSSAVEGTVFTLDSSVPLSQKIHAFIYFFCIFYIVVGVEIQAAYSDRIQSTSLFVTGYLVCCYVVYHAIKLGRSNALYRKRGFLLFDLMAVVATIIFVLPHAAPGIDNGSSTRYKEFTLSNFNTSQRYGIISQAVRLLILLSLLQRSLLIEGMDATRLEERRIWARSQFAKKKRQVLGDNEFVGRTVHSFDNMKSFETSNIILEDKANETSTAASTTNTSNPKTTREKSKITFENDSEAIDGLVESHKHDATTMSNTVAIHTTSNVLLLILIVVFSVKYYQAISIRKTTRNHQVQSLWMLSNVHETLSFNDSHMMPPLIQTYVDMYKEENTTLLYLQVNGVLYQDVLNNSSNTPHCFISYCLDFNDTSRMDEYECLNDSTIAIIDHSQELQRLELASVYSQLVLFFSLVLASFGLQIVIRKFAYKITTPLSQIGADMEHVAWMDVWAPLVMPSDVPQEIARLQDSFAKMKRMLSIFSQYVPIMVVRQIMSTGIIAQPYLELKKCTILIVEVNDFKSLCNDLGADDLFTLLSDYFDAMSTSISLNRGVLLDYLGDSIRAVWNAPYGSQCHACQAVFAATNMIQKLEMNLRPKWKEKGFDNFDIRIGIHTTLINVGNLGTNDRLKFTALGQGMETALEITDWNKKLGSQLLVSESVLQEPHVLEMFVTRPVHVIVDNTNEGFNKDGSGGNNNDEEQQLLKLHTVMARRNLMDGVGVVSLVTGLSGPDVMKLCAIHHEAFNAYMSGDFEGSVELCQRVLAIAPDDKTTKILLQNSEYHLKRKEEEGA